MVLAYHYMKLRTKIFLHKVIKSTDGWMESALRSSNYFMPTCRTFKRYKLFLPKPSSHLSIFFLACSLVMCRDKHFAGKGRITFKDKMNPPVPADLTFLGSMHTTEQYTEF